MGSIAPSFPDKASPDLILTHPTESERRRTWALTHPNWGPALSRDDYLDREAYAMTLPLAKDGGLTHWILTDRSPPDERPILSSCETLRKRAVRTTTDPDRPLVDGIVFGIGSVFTDSQFRGRGYADRMLRDVGKILPSFGSGSGQVLCSVLYSDIGKTFYAKKGWAAFPSRHAAFPAVPRAAAGVNGLANVGVNANVNGYADGNINGDMHGGANGGVNGIAAQKVPVRVIGYHELAELCCVDERLLRAELVRRARTGENGNGNGNGNAKTAVALLPDLDQLLWHLMREDYMTTRIFGRTPAARGAVAGERGRRVWAVWARGYYGGRDKIEGNTMHVLRLVLEDETQPAEYLAEALRGVLRIAQAEAAEWLVRDVQVWNPGPKLAEVIQATGLKHQMVDRDEESIASMMWFGEERTEDLDWVANEKYGWS